MLLGSAICLPCRVYSSCWQCAIVSRNHGLNATRSSLCGTFASRYNPETKPGLPRQYVRFVATNEIPANATQSSPSEIDVAVGSSHGGPHSSIHESTSAEDRRSQLKPEDVARHARKTFGDRLPHGALLGHEYKIYERLYGAPLDWRTDADEESAAQPVPGKIGDVLLKEAADGSLEQIEYDQQFANIEDATRQKPPDNGELDASLQHVDPELRSDIEAALADQDVQSQEDRRRDVKEAVDREPEDEPNIIDLSGLPPLRTHPFTLSNRTGTDPTTIALPKSTLTAPVATILTDEPNQHLRETAERCFGGPGLPYSTGTPQVSRTIPQKPIPLSASQARMLPREANVFLAALMPGMYASLTHVLVESRRNLGTDWVESLLSKEGGPSILDAGAGGAGVLAWREILKAEHARIREQKLHSELSSEPTLGKSTVLTASSALRQCASTLLGDTTFLPRLPDYVHIAPRQPTNASDAATEKGLPHGRKSFDVIVAPHTLWPLQEEWARRQHIQNLWAMLNPDGGLLILLEKGVPRGFEVLAGARQYLLDDLFISDPATNSSNTGSHAEQGKYPAAHATYEPKNERTHYKYAAPGAIVAPCTTHAKCPMYRIPGISRQRKDYCRFAQRYHRPAYQQAILGAKSRNHEDVEFSYVSVIKGRTAHELGRVGARSRLMGKEATDRAFRGYEVGDSDVTEILSSSAANGINSNLTPSVTATASEPAAATTMQHGGKNVLTTPAPTSAPPHPLTLPRLILAPLKKPRHVLLDVCTPSGTLERWSVPRGWSRQAYRDARKSAWGDLWALGGKTREGRRIRMGRGRGGDVVVDGMQGMAIDQSVGVDEEASENEDDVDGGQARGPANTASIHGGVEDQTQPTVTSRRRRPRTFTGRLKARTRKREERAEMAAAQSKKASRVEEED